MQNAVDYLPVERIVTYDAVVIVHRLQRRPAHDEPAALATRHGRLLLDRIVELRTRVPRSSCRRSTGPRRSSTSRFARAALVDEHAERLNEITRGALRVASRRADDREPRPQRRRGRRRHGTAAGDRDLQAHGGDHHHPPRPLLDDHFARGREDCPLRYRPQTDDDRLEAIRALGILDTPHEKRFDDIVERARMLLGTSGAAFSMVDRDRVWNKAVSRATAAGVPERGRDVHGHDPRRRPLRGARRLGGRRGS